MSFALYGKYPTLHLTLASPTPAFMLKNIVKTALRNVRKGGFFSFINIFGLAVSLLGCLLISLFVTDELSYDRYNNNADRIFRIVYDAHMNGNGFTGNFSPYPMGPTLVKDYPGIQSACRIRMQGDMQVKKGNETEVESSVVLADSSLFSIFTLPMVEGNPATALKAPYTMVISERAAKKYFNTTEIIGRSLVTKTNNDTATYTITGVIKDMPAASHFHFDFIKSMAEKENQMADRWINPFCATYLLAKPGITAAGINKMLATTIVKYIAPQLQQQANTNLEDMQKHGDYMREFVMPLTKIHLYSNVQWEFEANGSIIVVKVFTIIAVLVLLIAGMNFVNLSTARSADKAKETGVRKVLGATRSNLLTVFLFEAVIESLLAGISAIFIALLILPYFNQLSGKNFHSNVLFQPRIYLSYLAGVVLIGFMAGIYPAFFLSSFKPVNVLKGLTAGFKPVSFRNVLVVFQFTAAIALITGTAIIYNQLNYIRHRDVGYNREQVLTVYNTSGLGGLAKSFQQSVSKLPGIITSTMTGYLPNKVHDGAITYYKDARANGNEAFLLQKWQVDAQYVSTLGIKILSGRNFSPAMATDSSGVLINETAARLLGYSHPVNQLLYRSADAGDAFKIIGIVQDFNGGSLHNKVEPIVLHLADNRQAVSFKMHTNNIKALLTAIQQRYKAVSKATGVPFVYSFMDDDFNKVYQADEQAGSVFIAFSIFAIFIACLGLLGLVTYSAEKRAKEIGIRKVLGASVTQIAKLIVKDFIKLQLLACVIACPLAVWAMSKWLEGFAYRATIKWWVLALAMLLTTVITILTITFTTVKAAVANPAKSLKAPG